MIMITTIHRIHAISAMLIVDRNRRNCVAACRLKSELVVPQRRTDTSEFFPPLVRGGPAFFLAIGATSPSVERSVAVAYQVIGRTVHRR